jgi:hypothetical protein
MKDIREIFTSCPSKIVRTNICKIICHLCTKMLQIEEKILGKEEEITQELEHGKTQIVKRSAAMVERLLDKFLQAVQLEWVS